MGTQIFFESNLEKWRETVGCPLQSCNPIKQFSWYDNVHSSSPQQRRTSISISPSPRSSPYPQPSTPEPPQNNSPTLAEILNETKKGFQLVEYYNEHKEFKEEQRVVLINTVAQYFEERDLNLPLAITHRLEREIVDRFPSEKLVRNMKKIGLSANIILIYAGILSYSKERQNI